MAAIDNNFTISHEFDAPVESVFHAWTNTDHLAQWFAPKGYSVRFLESDIKPGGVSHYCMTSKHGLEMWGKIFYKDIIKPAKLSYTQCYSNEKGRIEPHPMIKTWPIEILTTVMLDEKGHQTLLKLTWEPVNASVEEITKFADGFFETSQEWGGTFDQLAEYLASG